MAKQSQSSGGDRYRGNIQKFLTRLNAQQAEFSCGVGVCIAHRGSVGVCLPGRHHGVFVGRYDHFEECQLYEIRLAQTTNVGWYSANPWGFFNMHGNVWEWTADAYGAYASGAQTDPFNAEAGSNRVIRHRLVGQ